MSRYYLLLLLVFVLSATGQAQTVCLYVPPPANAPVRDWDQAPLLLASTRHASGQTAKEQSEAAILQFIYRNFRWPPMAHCGEGVIVIGFVIDTNGTVEKESIRCVRSFHPSVAEEGIRIIELMADLQMRWQPAEKDGQQVRAQFYVPIRVRLE